MTCIFIMIGIVAVSLVLYMFLCWIFDGRGNAKLKYKDFQKYYEINPGRWRLYKTRVVYHAYIDTFNEIHEYFNFGFIDFCRYTLWLAGLEKAEKHKRNAESIQRMLNSMHEEGKKHEHQIS